MSVGMPINGEAAEDRVIESFTTWCESNGIRVNLLERPDRLVASARSIPELTSDGLVALEVDGLTRQWSVDVMSLAEPASHHIVPNGLVDRLDAIALRFGVSFRVEGDSPQPNELAGLAKAVELELATQGNEGYLQFSGVSVSWLPTPPGEAPRTIIEALWLEASSALLSDQVRDQIREPLIKKAQRQARRGKEAGCYTAVLLDWVGHAGIAQGTFWLPQDAFTIKQAVKEVLAGVEHNLDAVLLLDREGVWHLLYGEFPRPADMQ
ncbi:MAG: hypothetical protein Q8M73_00250 [Actinomycetota bacterium]|nr:hypothetical protein [Actinomycetota bacterium]